MSVGLLTTRRNLPHSYHGGENLYTRSVADANKDARLLG